MEAAGVAAAMRLTTCLALCMAIVQQLNVCKHNKKECCSLRSVILLIHSFLNNLPAEGLSDGGVQAVETIKETLENSQTFLGKVATTGPLMSLLHARDVRQDVLRFSNDLKTGFDMLASGEKLVKLNQQRMKDLRVVQQELRTSRTLFTEQELIADKLKDTAAVAQQHGMHPEKLHTLLLDQLDKVEEVSSMGPVELLAELQALQMEAAYAADDAHAGKTKPFGDKTEEFLVEQICAACAPKAAHAGMPLIPEALATPPDGYLCPISKEIMVNPVMLMETGQTYELGNIQRWLQTNNTCPATGEQLHSNKQLKPNYALKKCIEHWAKEHGMRLPDAPVCLEVAAVAGITESTIQAAVQKDSTTTTSGSSGSSSSSSSKTAATQNPAPRATPSAAEATASAEHARAGTTGQAGTANGAKDHTVVDIGTAPSPWCRWLGQKAEVPEIGGEHPTLHQGRCRCTSTSWAVVLILLVIMATVGIGVGVGVGMHVDVSRHEAGRDRSPAPEPALAESASHHGSSAPEPLAAPAGKVSPSSPSPHSPLPQPAAPANTSKSSAAAQPPPGQGWVAVAAGGWTTCGIISGSRQLRCWGGNNLFDPKFDPTVPVQLAHASWAKVSIDANYGVCVCGILADSSELHCWGGCASIPRDVATAACADVATAFYGDTADTNQTCAIFKDSNKMRCWNWTPTNNNLVPVDYATLRWSSVSVGFGFVCGILADSAKLRCWRVDGTYNMAAATPPADVASAAWAAVVAGPINTCGIEAASGNLTCWGDNTSSQNSVPQNVNGWVAVAAGWWHVCGITKGSARLLCWGDDSHNQIIVPSDLVNSSWIDVAAGIYHTCGILSGSGALKCWGDNSYGQLNVHMLP